MKTVQFLNQREKIAIGLSFLKLGFPLDDDDDDKIR